MKSALLRALPSIQLAARAQSSSTGGGVWRAGHLPVTLTMSADFFTIGRPIADACPDYRVSMNTTGNRLESTGRAIVSDTVTFALRFFQKRGGETRYSAVGWFCPGTSSRLAEP